jgi:hypothetical protein
MVQNDPQRNYAAVKKIIVALDEAQRADEARRFGGGGGGGEKPTPYVPTSFDLDHCESGSRYFGSAAQDDKIAALADLAVDSKTWSSTLVLMKYPNQVWEPALRSYENAQLGEMRRAQGQQLQAGLQARKQAFMKQFASQLSSYQRSHPTLGNVVNEGACHRPSREVRAGNVGLQISTDPMGGSVFLIPSFFYELCRAQNINPDDTVNCNRWREAISGRAASVAGDYVYFVRWPDGAMRRGKLSVVDREFGNVVVLRKQ